LLIPVTEQYVLDYVRQSFPTAQVLRLAPSFDHTQTQAYAAIVRPSDAAASLGVTVSFGARGQVMQHVEGPARWPAGSGPQSTATIRGTLLITAEQAWRPLAFRVSGARHASLSIDGQTWSGADGTPPIRLGAGNHRLVVLARDPVGATLGMQWNIAPSTAAAVGAQSWSEVPSTMLAAPTLPTGGLLGLYFTGPQIGAAPALARVDQSVYTYYQTPPVGSNFPFAARWKGTLHIVQGGSYSFKLNSVGPGTLLIDGRAVVTSIGADAIGTVVLGAGDHAMQLDYSGTGSYLHCYLMWAPPGQSFSLIPAGATDPAHG
jgi:hypothetical protein